MSRGSSAKILEQFQSGSTLASAGLQARVPRREEKSLQALSSTTSAPEARNCTPDLNGGLKAHTTRASGYTNPGTALQQEGSSDQTLLAGASERHWPQEAQFRRCRDESNFLRVAQEELQTGVVFSVEIVLNVLGEIGMNVGFAQPNFG